MQVLGLLKTAGTTAIKTARYAREVLPFGNKIDSVRKTTGKIAQDAITTLERKGVFQYVAEKKLTVGKKLLRYANYSSNEQVAEIEKRLVQKGVNVRFNNNHELATLVEKCLGNVQKEGFNVPKDILISDIPDIHKYSVIGWVPQFRKKTALNAPLELSKNYISQQKEFIEESIRLYKEHKFDMFSTNTMDSSILHEIGHWLHFQDIPDKKTCEKIWSTVNEKAIVQEVSFYAKNEKDGIDFVAEVFAGLMEGQRYSEYVMDIYKQLHGPMPKSLLKETSKLDKVV